MLEENLKAEYFVRLGHGKFVSYEVSRRHIAAEINNMAQEQMIPHILSLAKQSKWTDWDHTIDLDLKWKEVMYGMSPSTLSFVLNSIQDTLPDPANLRRWNAAIEPACGLCGWKNVSHVHILCGCKVAIDQGRVSYRHDSVLKVIHDSLSRKINNSAESQHPTNSVSSPAQMYDNFVKKGVRHKDKKDKKTVSGILDTASDWTCQIDLRSSQAHFPPSIWTTSERPDIVIFSPLSKQVIILELTSPAEENMEKWREQKMTKYEKLVEQIRHGTSWKPHLFTVEVGARGFVSKRACHVWSRLGLSAKDGHTLNKDLSRMAIRCSHFIWICRDTFAWSPPSN